MKSFKAIVCLLLLCTGMQAMAGNKELVAVMKKQQKQAETEIVSLWNKNKRGEETAKVLSDYVVREVRLRSILGTNDTGSLLSAVMKEGQLQFETPQGLAQAIVVEHYRRQGVDVSDNRFVRGTYLIRITDLGNNELPEKNEDND